MESKFSMLPDEILVHIGKSVTRVCGIQDFIFLSRTSKRLRHLLMKPKTIAEIMERENQRILGERSSWLLPSCTSTPIVAKTLEQLAFYDRIKEHNFLEENRFNNNPKLNLGWKIRNLLQQHPTATVVLDAHSGRGEIMAITPYGMFDYRAKHAYDTIVLPDSGISSERLRIRTWGRAAADVCAESHHPYHTKARKGKGWVEFFLELRSSSNNSNSNSNSNLGSNPDDESDHLLELPPRPDFYKHLEIPEEQRYRDFVYVDSSDSSSDDDG
jgi:hypothetical protein